VEIYPEDREQAIRVITSDAEGKRIWDERTGRQLAGVLPEYADLDMSGPGGSPDAESLKVALAPTLPEPQWRDFLRSPFYWPRSVWRIRGGEPRFLVFCGKSAMNPGESRAAIIVFSQDGKYLGGSDISIGWKVYMTGARMRTDTRYGTVVEVPCTADMVPPFLKVFGLDGSRPLLLRVEDGKGQRMPSQWYDSDYPTRTASQWSAQLSATSPVQVLEALNWWERLFSGGSGTPPNVEWIKLGTPLKPLLTSKDPWIREAAEAVQKGLDAWLHPSAGKGNRLEPQICTDVGRSGSWHEARE